MRNGYDKSFLGSGFEIELPEPGLALQTDVLEPPGLPDGETVVPYIHYSVLMSKSTKQALYSAANVDNTKMKTLGRGRGRNWFIDSRVGRDNQIPNYPYTGSMWDRGHLTRRSAVTWGANRNYAEKASNDSCAYTNACMQHEYFNEDDWRAVEELVSNFEKATKLTVITGPIFTQADRYFTKEFSDQAVRIPAGFWKTISYVANNRLNTHAYLFFQDLPSISTKAGRERINLKDMQITTTELSLWTGLEFDHAMFNSNPLKFYSGPQAYEASNRRAFVKRKQGVLLTAGIPTARGLSVARNKLKIQELYDLVSEVSWI